jgi:hypothetical protein
MLPPANRIVAFAGPYLSVIAGGIAAWLVSKVNVAGIDGLDKDNLQTTIAGGLAWLLVAGLSWAGHSKWLTGHHIQLQADGKITAAMAAAPPAAAPATAGGNGYRPDRVDALDDVQDPATEGVPDSHLVSDEVEFSSPPSPASDTPAEPEDL